MKQIFIFTSLFLFAQTVVAHDIPVLHEHLSVLFGTSAHSDHLVQVVLIIFISIILTVLVKQLFKSTK